LLNDGDDSDADVNTNVNDGLLGHLLDTSIKADNNNSKIKADVAYNCALE
jgi:hypothetical protein